MFAWRRPGLLVVVFLLGPLTLLGQERPKAAEPDTKQAQPRGGKPEAPEGTITDAEKIARLQRAVEESTKQIETLNAKLNDPNSEFKQAEKEFTDLDQKLTELRKQRDSAETAERRDELQKEIGELEPKHKLAKDRFDVAIGERKTLQEQIATLQQKLQQDNEALKKLKGETPPATQPAAEGGNGATPAPTSAPAVPASKEPEGQAPTPAPGVPGAAPTPAVPAQDGAAANGQAAPAPELKEAREEASRKEAEAQSAQAEVASITERMGALRKSIELEHKLLEASRKKVGNAQATERALYETLQKKMQDGAPQSELQDVQKQIADARERLREAQEEQRKRTDRLDELQAELSELQDEHIAAMEEAQKRGAEAEDAQKKVAYLESPFSPQNLWRWTLQRGPKVAGILLGMFALLWISRVGEKRLVKLMTSHGVEGSVEDRENRAKTLVSVFHSAAIIAVYGGGGLMILTEVGVNIIPLMGGAAVIGLAAAFGAQNLVRDYFYGFVILMENQYGVNDVVKIGDVSGLVERISIRCTVLRGLDGTVHFIPNGEITRVSNMTHQWSRALFDIPVAYKEDVDRVMNELMELAKELRRDPEFRGLILEMPEMLGVDEFADSAIVIKFFIKTRPLKQFPVKRELLRRIKKRFDEIGIEIPFPHRTVYHRYENGAPDELRQFEVAREQGAEK